MAFLETIKVNTKWTDDYDTASDWLSELPGIIACDFEVASKYTESQKEQFRNQLNSADKWTAIDLKQKIESDGLSHPALTVVTHLSIAWSESESIVIVLSSSKLRDAVLHWLADTDRKQIWHNAVFDLRHVLHHTGNYPIDIEDTHILAKTLLNNVNNLESKTGLKELMGTDYGDWAIAKELDFTLENMYNEKMIEYAGIDSAATYKLYKDIHHDLKEM